MKKQYIDGIKVGAWVLGLGLLAGDFIREESVLLTPVQAAAAAEEVRVLTRISDALDTLKTVDITQTALMTRLTEEVNSLGRNAIRRDVRLDHIDQELARLIER